VVRIIPQFGSCFEEHTIWGMHFLGGGNKQGIPLFDSACRISWSDSALFAESSVHFQAIADFACG